MITRMMMMMMMMMTTTMTMIIGHIILTLWNRMNILHPTKPNSTDNLGEVKVSQQIDAGKCD